MNGRQESEIKIDLYVKRKIQEHNCSSILTNYYNSFIDETYKTRKKYVNDIILFIDFLLSNYNINLNNIEDINKIKTLHVNEYLNSFSFKEDGITKNTNSYKAGKLAAVKNFFDFLVDNDLASKNICDKIKKPKDKKEHKIISLTEDEITQLKENIVYCKDVRLKNVHSLLVNRDLSIVFLGITTGLRVSAICNINIDDIDFDNRTIRVIEKGDVERSVYVPVNVLGYIQKWLKDRDVILHGKQSNALFISMKRERISDKTIRYMLKKYTYNINKNITPHKLRSTAATNLLEKTGDIYLVSEVLGHKNIQNTRKYARTSKEKIIAAADILGELI